jgi:hypothetical protein
MAEKLKKTISGLEILIFVFAFFSPWFQAKAAQPIPAIMISAWIKPSGSLASKVIIAKNNELRLVTDGSGNLLCQEHDGSGWNYSATSSAALQLGSWQHVACLVYKTVAGVKVYVNGRLSGNGAGYGSGPNNSNSHLLIGKDESGTYGDFQGYIDEPKIRNNFSNAVPGIEVWQDYNAGKAGNSSAEGANVTVGESPKWVTDGLVGHWKMDETSGTVVADASGNGNTGTLTNAQETGTSDASGNSVTTMADTSNASLSTTNDAYNGMIIRFTAACGSITDGTERTITDYAYSGSISTFTVATLAQAPDSCAYEVRHQTGGKFGNGLAFDSANDSIGLMQISQLTSYPATVSLWVKGTTGSNNWNGNDVAFEWRSDINNVEHRIYSTGGFPKIQFTQNDDTNKVSNTQSAYLNDTWYHYTLIIPYGTNQPALWYINGSLFDTVYPDSGKSWKFANYAGIVNDANSFKGSLDDVRVYNRALAPDEVKQLSEYGPGPVGWWKMDEGSGQYVNDSSGNGINLFVGSNANSETIDPIWTNGKYGNGLQFNSAENDQCNLTTSVLNFRDAITVETWVKVDQLNKDDDFVTQNSSFILKKDLATNKLSFQFWDGGAWRAVLSSKVLASGDLGTWMHVAATYSNDTGKEYLYINGVKDNEATPGSKLINQPGSAYFKFGMMQGHTSSYYLDGSLDDIRVYNYARNSKQVVEDMNAGHPIGGSPVGSPVAYYKMDEGQGQAVYDSSPNHNNLQLGATGGVESTDPTWTNSGKFGRALNFSKASSQYAQASDSPSLSITSNLTLSAWIKPTSNSAGTRYDIVEKGCSSISYNLAQYGSELRMFVDSSSNYKTSSGANLQTGTWYHVAGVYNAAAQTVTLFVNGKDVGGSVTGTIPSSIADGAEGLTVGDICVYNYFDGLIDEVKVYASALTPDQIAMDMNQGKEMQLGGQSSATGATGQAAEYCVPGDATSCAGPVGEWSFNEKTGGSVNDTSGNGNIGTWSGTGTHWARGKYGSAGNFGGSSYSDRVSMDYSSSLNPAAFTVSFWAYPQVGGSYLNAICSRGSLTGYYIYVLSSNGRWNFTTGNGASWNSIGSAASAATYNQWQYITAVYDGTYSYLYVNGVLAAGPNAYTLSPNLSSNFFIGSTTGDYFSGKIDQVRVFNYARTPAQIAWDYNRRKPVGWWKMDEGEGGSAYDSSGNSSTGTLTSMDPPNDWVTGKFGKALDFDGSNDYVNVLHNTIHNAYPISVSAWVKTSTNEDSYRGIVSKYVGASSNGYQVYIRNGKLCAWYYSAAGGFVYMDDPNDGGFIADGSWHHVIFTVDSSGGILFVDGVQKKTRIWVGGSAGATTTADSLKIGNYNNSGYFPGQIDDVRVYNYALTAEQVKQVMNEGSVVRFGE